MDLFLLEPDGKPADLEDPGGWRYARPSNAQGRILIIRICRQKIYLLHDGSRYSLDLGGAGFGWRGIPIRELSEVNKHRYWEVHDDGINFASAQGGPGARFSRVQDEAREDR